MRGLRLITLAAIPVLVLSACSSSTTSPTPGATTIRWYVGLGSGTQAAQIADQQAFVKDYNTKNPGTTLKLEIVPNANAYDVLKTEIAAGNGPDVIGPVGVKGRNGFDGLFLDLTNEISKQNFPISAYDQATVNFLKTKDGQIGIPYTIFPGYLWYNKDLFAAAGLQNLPTTVGAQYNGATWDWNAVETLAEGLTTDQAGAKSTDPAFDKTKIATYGIAFQWADARRMASCFGPGSFVADDFQTAQIPQAWSDAFNWYYTAIWTKYVSPDTAAINSTYLNSGNLQSSGHLAMNAAWGWSISSIATTTHNVKTWDLAVMPSWNGVTTAGMDADTFVIAKSSKNPDAAFKAMVAIEASSKLMQDYGGEPAKTADQAAFFTAFDTSLAKDFTGNTVTWSVLGEMQKHPAVPSIEANMPGAGGGLQAQNDYGAFYTKLQTTGGLTISDELNALKTKLQADFDAVKPPSQ